MQPTSYPMPGTMINQGVGVNPMPSTMVNTGAGINPMPGTMVNTGVGVNPMLGTMVNTGVGVNPMPSTMVNPGVYSMGGGMINQGVYSMGGGMVNQGVYSIGCGMGYQMPNPAYQNPNLMVNPAMYSPNMVMNNQNGYMTGMYPMNTGMTTISNPNVNITGISNANVPITSVSYSNVPPVNNGSNNQGNENNGEQPPPSLLSRDTQLIGEVVDTSSGLINVYFEASTGSKAVLNIKETDPIKEVLEKYADKVKLNKQYIVSKKIIFLYLNKQIDPNSTDPVSKINIHNLSKINVFDQNNVLGA